MVSDVGVMTTNDSATMPIAATRNVSSSQVHKQADHCWDQANNPGYLINAGSAFKPRIAISVSLIKGT